ncbi:probable tRNA (uracil-O(2)-)-methyltransferase [Procambarus clarkii]|uniref:probable tRNA (uracil-O(2)-)-methyltransferase n=1 Tax=Procambarus clarkii TaxID=6728 RepID=UPI0037430CB4
MEKQVEELPLEALPCQFWGAVKIYTEKPHIINRRICGAVNLWIGVTHDNFSRQRVLGFLDEILNYDVRNKVENVHGSPILSGIVYDNNNSTEVIGSKSNNADSEGADCQAELNQIEKIKDVLCKCGLRSLQETSNSDCSDNMCGQEKGASEDNDLKDHDHFKFSSIANVNTRQLDIPWQQLLQDETLKIAVIRRVLPKQVEKFTPPLEIVLIDGENVRVSYFAASKTAVPSVVPCTNYSLSFTTTGIGLSYFEDNGSESPEARASTVWLQKNVLPKLKKWSAEVQEGGDVEDKGSLKLINVQEYNQLYQQLKIKYGKALVKMWPETTDPLKYVYEDIAIATYLILIWQQERKKKGLTTNQTFVDLGCGNGLLVHILSSEGHQGLGIDIKKRHIWDMFPKHIQLKEEAIEPSDKNLFPAYDWLIGNHSDELTPWIPVIAAKSKYTTRFFVIPCCAHDFDCKYRRKYTGRSQYSDYLEYVKEVGSVCGFEVWQDKLRIPSTKRVCLIGQERTYSALETPQMNQKIDQFIRKRSTKSIESQTRDGSCENLGSNTHKAGNHILWTENFKAREAVQAVRNCTQLEKTIKDDLVSTVARMLMEKKHILEVEISKNSFVTWDRGGSMTLGDIAKRMEPNQLSALKNECGGLQTLLKNHKHIFNISRGVANLQIPIPVWRAKVSSSHIKTKLCWFHINHITGCPLPSQTCVYAHGNSDLKDVREVPSK